MIVEQIPHNYVVLPPTQADLTGFKVGGLMRTNGVISGSDLGINSRWAVVSKKHDVFTYRSVESPQTVWVWTGRIADLQTIFTPQADENYQA